MNEPNNPTTPTSSTRVERHSTTTTAADYVLQLFNQKQDMRLVYHNYRQAAEVVDLINEIGYAENASAGTLEIARLAGWFYLTGFLFAYENPFPEGKRIANNWMAGQQISQQIIHEVNTCLQTTEANSTAQTTAAKIFSDAVNAWQFAADFTDKMALQRLELDLVLQQVFSKADWTQFQLQRLMRARFFSGYGKKKYAPIVAHNLLTHKALTEKSKNNTTVAGEHATQRTFENLERKLPERATQTFFRTNYRNHINLSAIADGKANIMISVNTILISVVISIASYQNITETRPYILAPIIVFLIFGLSSLIFAVLSARPKVTSVNKETDDNENINKNIVFFGNFAKLDLQAYEEAMDTMLRDGELLYGNMTRDLYYLGKVLEKKYRYLSLSYNIFMVGFIATVLMFLVAILT